MSFSLIPNENQFQDDNFYYRNAQKPQTVPGFTIPAHGTNLFPRVSVEGTSINKCGAAHRAGERQR